MARKAAERSTLVTARDANAQAASPERVTSPVRRAALTAAGRIAKALAVLLIVSFGATGLSSLIPGSPAYLVLGLEAPPEAVRDFDQKFGYDQPLLLRYWHWLEHAVHGDLGRSVLTGVPVTTTIKQALPVTLQIGLISLVLSLTIAIVLAMISVARPGGWVDRAITAVSSLLDAVPGFVAVIFLVYLFALQLAWLPSSGWVPVSTSLTGNLERAALPILTLTLTHIALPLRVLRGDMVSVLSEDYIAFARARGLPEWYVLLRHAFRPAALSLVTIAGLMLGHLFAGSIIVETFYAVPGVGFAASTAQLSKDVSVVQGIVVVVAAAFLVTNLLVDLVYPILDPRLRDRVSRRRR